MPLDIPPGPRTRIVATIGPASSEPGVLRRMIRSGVNVARLNFAHGTPAEHAELVRRIRGVAAECGRRVAVMADLPGPKLRIGRLREEPVYLRRGHRVTLTTEPLAGDASLIPVSFAGLPDVVRPGDSIYLNDGFIQLRVVEVAPPRVLCEVLVGGALTAHKGLNLPGLDLGIPAITEADRQWIRFAVAEGIDILCVSFVACAGDLAEARALAEAEGRAPMLIAKIERTQAVAAIDEILAVADGIMVARGDLGVETPIEATALQQKRLIHKANLAGRPVITATQMLESMIHNARPTRAEATDVANAILDGTDAVMLSGESAMGDYPVESVAMLAGIARATEAGWARRPMQRTLEEHLCSGGCAVPDAIAINALHTVRNLQAPFVVTPTRSGASARRIARFRLDAWVVAFCLDETTCRRLCLSWGVHPVLSEEDRPDWRGAVCHWFHRHGREAGQAVLIQGMGGPGSTDRLEVLDLARCPVP